MVAALALEKLLADSDANRDLYTISQQEPF